MKVGKPTGAGAVSFNFTPVIDIVFDLLIFFVLTAQFSVLQYEDVTLPVSTTGEIKDYAEFHNVVINVVHPDDPAIMVLGDTLTYPELVGALTDMRKKSESEGASRAGRLDVRSPMNPKTSGGFSGGVPSPLWIRKCASREVAQGRREIPVDSKKRDMVTFGYCVGT